MTQQELNMLHQLRDKGYAVAVWNPEELRGVNPSDVEDIMIERAADFIDSMATGEEDEA